jgi:hypothetical protein
MNKRTEEFFARNSELSIELSKLVLDNPQMDDILTEEAVVVFLPDFDPELREFNLSMGREIESEGHKVLYVMVRQMAPEIPSRLIGVEFRQSV